MSRRLSAGPPVPPQAPRRGKYDRWLDGATWELRPGDTPWFAERRLVRRALARRARRCGLRLWWQVLADGTLAVRAAPRRPQAPAHADIAQGLGL